MLRHYCFVPASVILLALINSVAEQVPSIIELARGNWIVEYEGNVMQVKRIGRFAEYQPRWRNSWYPRSDKIEAPPGSEVAVVYLRTERVTAKMGFGSRHVVLTSVGGDEYEYEGATEFLGGPYGKLIDPTEHFYEIAIVVPEGTRFSRVVLVREKYEPRRREEIIIELPGGA